MRENRQLIGTHWLLIVYSLVTHWFRIGYSLGFPFRRLGNVGICNGLSCFQSLEVCFFWWVRAPHKRKQTTHWYSLVTHWLLIGYSLVTHWLLIGGSVANPRYCRRFHSFELFSLIESVCFPVVRAPIREDKQLIGTHWLLIGHSLVSHWLLIGDSVANPRYCRQIHHLNCFFLGFMF